MLIIYEACTRSIDESKTEWKPERDSVYDIKEQGKTMAGMIDNKTLFTTYTSFRLFFFIFILLFIFIEM